MPPLDDRAWPLRTGRLTVRRLGEPDVVGLGGVVVGDLFLMRKDGWRGLATEAVGFEDLGLRRVTAGCFADAVPSWRLTERVGMRRELHAVAESLHRELGWVDGTATRCSPRSGGPPAADRPAGRRTSDQITQVRTAVRRVAGRHA